MERCTTQRIVEYGLFTLLLFAVVWKGGKGLDAVWLLAGIASLLTIADVIAERSIKTAGATGDVPQGLWWVVSGFAVWTMISWFTSTTPNYGFDEVLMTVSLALIFFWVIRNRSNLLEHRFIKIMAVATIIACAVGVAVYILQPLNRFVGTFFDYRFHTDYWPNAWAEYLLFAWPLLVLALYEHDLEKVGVLKKLMFWKHHDDSKWLHILRAAIVGFVLSCLLLSYSRGAFLAFTGQLVLAGILLGWKGRGLGYKKMMKDGLIAILVAVILFVGINHIRSRFHPVQSVTDKVTFSASEGTSSIDERSQFFAQSLQLAEEKPVFGYGPYSFRFVQTKLMKGVLATSDHPHNVFLKYAMERGWVAALLFAGMLCIIFFAFIKGLWNKPSPLQLFIFMSCAGVLAHNLIDYNLQFVGIALPLWIGFGFLAPASKVGSGKTRQWIGAIAAAILLLVAAREAYQLVLSSRARHAEVAGEREKAIEYYQKAEGAWFPRDNKLSLARVYVQQGAYSQALEVLAPDGPLEYSEDYRAWKLAGEAALQMKQPAAALADFTQAFERGKYADIALLRGIIDSLLALNNTQAITLRRREFEGLMNDFNLAILQNAHFIALGPQVEELEKVLRTFMRVYPAERAQYQALIDRMKEHAEKERGTYSARPRGLLW